MNKNRVRLTESQLHRIIKESVRRVIKEHSTPKLIKESNNNWRGCPNVQMIWHGANSDPELYADGCIANYWDVEDSLWYDFLEETGYSDSDSGDKKVESQFNQWLQANESNVIATIAEHSNEE